MAQSKNLNIPQEELNRLYNEQGLSSYEANIYGVSGVSIRYWMNKYNIKRRPNNKHIRDKVIGKEYHGFRIIECIGLDSQHNHKYNCECIKCGYIRKGKYSYIRKIDLKCPRCNPQCFDHLKKGYHLITGHYWSKVKYCAKSRNREVTVTPEYCIALVKKQNFKCNLSGLPIEFATTSRDYDNGVQTASLDRIDSNLGYTEDNIQWLHKRINLMKHELSDEEFIKFCAIVTDYQRSKK